VNRNAKSDKELNGTIPTIANVPNLRETQMLNESPLAAQVQADRDATREKKQPSCENSNEKSKRVKKL
jgi:hypothetical protein